MENKERKRNRILILILLLITLAAICLAVWALFFRDSEKPLVPDYAPETEENAEPIPGDTGEAAPSTGGGSVTITYSNQVKISLAEGTAELMFANPGKSNKDMVMQIIIGETVLAESGRLEPGNQVKTIKLQDGITDILELGGYDGKFMIYYFDTETGAQEIVNTEMPITITVEE